MTRRAMLRMKATALALALFAAAPLPAVAAGQGSNRQGRHLRQALEARPGVPSRRVRNYKVDAAVSRRQTANPLITSRVIVSLAPGAQLPAEFRRYLRNRNVNLIGGAALDLPNGLIARLAARPEIFRIHDDRPIIGQNYRTSVTVGALAARQQTGFTGDGIGIAIIDSGITSWHDDLTRGSVTRTYPYGDQRVARFVDFVGGRTQPYDDNGHGTHVAGIVAGNGYDSNGEKMGIAPKASLVSLKVLDADGRGSVSSIIAALDWVVLNHRTYNIRVVNLSVGAQIRESYWTDPLTLAAKRVTDLGITVVSAAGNRGSNSLGQQQYGGIVAPSNAPWVLTVGASSTEGTLTRKDDVMAGYSSSGPTATDFLAKPDLVAPGTGTVSLAAPGSTLAAEKLSSLLDGTLATGVKPYLSLSGTSMAAPVVSGTVALMLQANPNLTPNLVKAILQYTAQQYDSYNVLRQGAGFLNTLGAVKLAAFYQANRVGARLPTQRIWSRNIVWGNHRLSGGYLNPKGSTGEEVEHLGLDGDVQGADRLVGHDEVRTGRQGGGDAHALALPARHRRRHPVRAGGGHPHLLQEVGDATLAVARGADAVGHEGLGDRPAHAPTRVQAGEGVLEDRLHPAPELPALGAGQGRDVVPVEGHRPGGGPGQPEHAAGQRGLAAAGLPHQAQGGAALHAQRDVVDRPGGAAAEDPGGHAELLDQALHAQQRAHGAPAEVTRTGRWSEGTCNQQATRVEETCTLGAGRSQTPMREGQRSAKRHPGGGSVRSGTRPSITASSPWATPGVGRAASRARV